MTLLAIAGVSKRYGATVALDRVDLTLTVGARLAVVGPSGSGKTTLLRIIAGFEAPDEGGVSLQGICVADGPAIAPAHRRRIGYVAQDGALFPHLDVAGNIGFGLPSDEPDRAARLRELVSLVELDERMLSRKPHELSGGQQQRVALARAMARKPLVMLLDEPFSALDAGLRDSVRQAVARVLAQAGIAAVLVTHDQNEALSFAEQLAVMRDGRIAQAGIPRDLYWRPADERTALFLGEAVLLEAELDQGSVACALGRLQAETGSRRGRGRIMLRPEQIEVATVPVQSGRRGTVLSIAFSGSQSTAEIALDDGLQAPFKARVSGIELPSPGQAVFVTVKGMAHPLPLTGDPDDPSR